MKKIFEKNFMNTAENGIFVRYNHLKGCENHP